MLGQTALGAFPRYARATIVALTGASLGAAMHVTAGGPAPGPVLGAVLVLALATAAAPMLSRPATRTRVVLMAVSLQGLVHLILLLAAPASSLGSGSGAQHHQSHTTLPPGTAGTALATGPATGHHSHGLVSSTGGLVMLLAHVAAAVAVGVLLAAGERSLWSLVALLSTPARAARIRATAGVLHLWDQVIGLLAAVGATASDPHIAITGRTGLEPVVRRGPPAFAV